MATGILTRYRWVRWALAALFWTVIVLFYSARTSRLGQPVAFDESLKRAMSQWYVWGLLAPLIIWIDRRLPVAREALFRRALFHIPLGFLFTTAYVYLSPLARALLEGSPSSYSPSLAMFLNSWGGMFHWNLIIYWVIVGVYGSYDYYTGLRDRELHAAELERLLTESRLAALRTQLHPHFLFNALNAISALVERDPRAARRMLEQLGELLRLSLDLAEDQVIPLERELAFLDRYLAIQKVRFEDRLDVSLKVDPDVLDVPVPTFVLQPLVENAIRHGIAPRTDRGSIVVSAWRDTGRLHLRVQDDGPGLPTQWSPAVHNGVGLSNTRERLRRLYGNSAHTFEITSEPGAGVRVDLSFPLQPRNEVASQLPAAARR